jgi:hypothetical protein
LRKSYVYGGAVGRAKKPAWITHDNEPVSIELPEFLRALMRFRTVPTAKAGEIFQQNGHGCRICRRRRQFPVRGLDDVASTTEGKDAEHEHPPHGRVYTSG